MAATSNTSKATCTAEPGADTVADTAPSPAEIDAAVAVLARTDRYSVKDNELDDWIA